MKTSFCFQFFSLCTSSHYFLFNDDDDNDDDDDDNDVIAYFTAVLLFLSALPKSLVKLKTAKKLSQCF